MHRRIFLQSALAGTLSLTAWLNPVLASGGQWQTAQPLPVKIQELYPAVHNNRLYVAGGIAAKLGVPYFTNRCFSYDPTTNQWRQEPDLPLDLHHAALVSTGDRLFLVGGFNGGYSHIWRMQDKVYELVGNEWKVVSTLPNPQAEGVLATAPDGAVHLVTGQSPKGSANSKRSDHQEVTSHYRWQPGAKNWEPLAPIPTPRNSGTGGWIGEQLIVAGGRTAKGNLSVTEIYDRKTDSWRTAAPLPLPQAGTAGVVLDDGLMLFGGEMFIPESKVFKDVWRYSLSQDKWFSLPDMLTPRHGIGAGRFGNKVFVIGGATEPGGSGTSNVNEVLTL